MRYILIVLVIQIVTIVHVVRNGRNNLWIAAIVIAPVLGSLAYFLLEVLPSMMGNRHVRYARQKALQKIDPEREIRAAREQLEVTESVANRTRLADALADAERYEEAVSEYERILEGAHRHDDKLLFKYASALFEAGRAQEALDNLNLLEPMAHASAQDRRSLLKARIMEHLGRDSEADAIYADIVTRLAGIEARCRYAALLQKMGRSGDARAQLEEVLRRTRGMDRTQIGDDWPMFDWARTTLTQLET